MEIVTTSDFDSFAKSIKKEMLGWHPYDVRQCAEALINIASMLQMSNEMQCSCRVDLSDTTLRDVGELNLFEYAKSNLIDSAIQIGKHYGLTIERGSGDPRGGAIYVKVEAGKGDSWGDNSLLCIPSASACIFYA